jgi:signal transduction histidine kinase
MPALSDLLARGRERFDKSAGSAHDAETHALKEAVFVSVLRWFSAGAACVAALLCIQILREQQLGPSILIGSVMVGLVPGFLLLHPALGYPRTAVIFLGYILMACTYIQCARGLTAGVALAMVTFLLLSGLLFAARGGRWALAAVLGSLIASSLVSLSPFAARWDLELVDPQSPIVWLRYAAVLFFFGGSLLSAFTKLSDGYARIGQRLSITLERERAERAQREQVEEALVASRRLEALAQYAGGLAHDFNNSLMVIMGGTALIADDEQAGERVRALAQEVSNSAESSAQTVRHLLLLGRKSEPEPSRVNAEAIVQQCRSTLRRVLPETVSLKVEVDPLAELMVDIAGLQQTLLNLALNARDALGAGGAFTLRVQRRLLSETPPDTRARPGTFVVVSCQDTGTGMDETTRARLFEPFFSTKAAGKGSGLGLATVQRFVAASGGFITVETELGRGTAFHLHFPALEESLKSYPDAAAPIELQRAETL